MKTILVTGATGFIGSHTLRYLQQQPAVRLIAACRARGLQLDLLIAPRRPERATAVTLPKRSVKRVTIRSASR